MIAATPLLVHFACSSPPQHSLKCSDGPARTTLPRGAPSADGTSNQCVARCGATAIPNIVGPAPYALSGVPSGSCEFSGDRCQMGVSLGARTCNGVRETCDYSAVECECVDGAWQCYLTSQGSGYCPPCDAGTDPLLYSDAGAHD